MTDFVTSYNNSYAKRVGLPRQAGAKHVTRATGQPDCHKIATTKACDTMPFQFLRPLTLIGCKPHLSDCWHFPVPLTD
jgi:hypothetical protein